MSAVISSRVNVRSYELDVYGHVNNATYLNYLEYGRVEALRKTGKSFLEYMRENIFIVIAQVNVSFLRPAFLHDELEVTTRLGKIGRSSVVLIQEITNVTRNEKTLTAEVTAVFLNQDQRPIPVPQDFLRQLEWDEESKQVST